LNRIRNTIHSEQFRIDSMVFTAYFEYINGSHLKSFVDAYISTIEYYLNYLMGNRKNLEKIVEADVFTNIVTLPKVRAFIRTLYLILKTCLRFCEIVKILTGKNNLSLKFTVIKK